MGDLIPDAATLIRSGRGALRPDASDRARVLESLRRTLGEGALLEGPHGAPPGGGSVAAARSFSRWGKLLGGLSVLAVGAGIMVAPRLWTTAPAQQRPAPAALPEAPLDTAASATLALSREDERASEPQGVSHTSSAPRLRSHAVAATASDALTEEVRLLSKAERQLSDGLGDDALKTLGEHERRFPKGALAEERMAARVEALCALGRVAEARVDLSKLSRAFPRSAHLDGARRFCGSDVTGAP